VDVSTVSDSSCSNRSVADSRTLTSTLAALGAAALLIVVGAPEVHAQDLPSADQLESEDSGDSSPFDETGGDEESGTSEEGDDESSEQQSNQTAQGQETGEASGQDSSEGSSGQTEGSEKAPSGDQMSSSKSGEAETDDQASPESDAEAAAEQTEETAEQTVEGEGGEEDGDTDDDKRGELVETKTDTKREVEGRGATEGDVRWVQSGLNAYGAPGLQHIASADPRLPNTYDVSFFGEVTGGSSVIRAQDTNNFVAGRLLVHAQIIEYFSANIGIGAQNNVNSLGRPEAMLSQGDTSLALRGHYPATEFLDVGADVSLEVPTGFGSAGPDFAGTSVTPRLLGTLNVDPLVESMTLPLTAHLNFGYRVDNTSNTVPDNIRLTRIERFAHGISEYNALQLGLGVEYDLPYVSPFAEWNVDFPVAGSANLCNQPERLGLQCLQEAGFGAYPNKISFGLRGEPVEQLALHAGVDLSLTGQDAAGVPVTAPYKVFLGASWQIDPRARVEKVTKTVEKTRLVEEMPERGRIVGTIQDSNSETPVGGAQIAYPGTDRSPQVAGTDSGSFRSYGFPVDQEVTVRISHPNYKTKQMKVAVGKGDKKVQIPLEPGAEKTTFSGTVSAANGGPISGATVVLDGPETREVTTDGAGKFSVEVPTGSYTVGISAPDYQATRKTVEIGSESDGSTFSLEAGGNSSLVELGDKKIKVEERVSFASGTAQIDEDSFEILDAVAAKLRARPDIAKVEVQGHTDDVGSKSDNMELSEKRAQSVVDYLTDEGIDGDRLQGKGYGPEQPRVPNISERNRRMNRRVKFKILEQ
jgi:outer membrane protein OmpA-like peptidoglycan-associated protein